MITTIKDGYNGAIGVIIPIAYLYRAKWFTMIYSKGHHTQTK
jgi:hypothetical protein